MKKVPIGSGISIRFHNEYDDRICIVDDGYLIKCYLLLIGYKGLLIYSKIHHGNYDLDEDGALKIIGVDVL
jgi:hypothetical protein